MILKTPYARSYKNYNYSLCRGPWADDFTDFEGSTKPNNNHTIKLNTIYVMHCAIWYYLYVMHCAIWYYLHNFKNVKNTHGRVLLLVKL